MRPPLRLSLAWILALLGPLAWLAAHGMTFSRTISIGTVNSEGRLGFSAPAPLPKFLADSTDGMDASTASTLRLFENQRELGPPHTMHDTIRSRGGGAFSHWDHYLIFSTSDNSDPRTNGRTYHVVDRGFLTFEAGAILLVVPALALACAGLLFAALRRLWPRRHPQTWPSRDELGRIVGRYAASAMTAVRTSCGPHVEALMTPSSVVRTAGLAVVYSFALLMLYCSLIAQTSQSGTFKINFEYKVF